MPSCRSRSIDIRLLELDCELRYGAQHLGAGHGLSVRGFPTEERRKRWRQRFAPITIASAFCLGAFRQQQDSRSLPGRCPGSLLLTTHQPIPRSAPTVSQSRVDVVVFIDAAYAYRARNSLFRRERQLLGVDPERVQRTIRDLLATVDEALPGPVPLTRLTAETTEYRWYQTTVTGATGDEPIDERYRHGERGFFHQLRSGGISVHTARQTVETPTLRGAARTQVAAVLERLGTDPGPELARIDEALRSAQHPGRRPTSAEIVPQLATDLVGRCVRTRPRAAVLMTGAADLASAMRVATIGDAALAARARGAVPANWATPVYLVSPEGLDHGRCLAGAPAVPRVLRDAATAELVLPASAFASWFRA